MTQSNPIVLISSHGARLVRPPGGPVPTVKAQPGTRWRLAQEVQPGIDVDVSDVVAIRHGSDLRVRSGEGEMVIQDFFSACGGGRCTIDLPGRDGVQGLSGDSLQGAAAADAGRLVYAWGSPDAMRTLLPGQDFGGAGWNAEGGRLAYMPSDGAELARLAAPGPSPWMVLAALGAGVAVAGAGGGAGAGPASTPGDTVITGSVVAGPVIAGHNLQVVAYRANGTVLASGAVNDEGMFSLTLPDSYTGAVLIRVLDTASSPDYFDEATNAPKDLGTDLRAAAVIPAPGTYNVNLNVLTELAVRQLGLQGGDAGTSAVGLGPLTAEQILAGNANVAQAVGLSGQDLVTGPRPRAVIDPSGQADPAVNDYGRLLAALSGAERGLSTDAVLDTLVGQLGQGVLDSLGLAMLMDGAAIAGGPGSALVERVSELTSPVGAVSVASVAGDNTLNGVEAQQSVQLQGNCPAGASVTVTVGGTNYVATTSGTTWSVTLAPGILLGLAQGAEIVTATATLNGTSQVAQRAVFVDTLAPVVPTLSTVNDTADTTPLLAGTAEPGSTVDVTVGGATFRTVASAQGLWSVDTGNSTPVSGAFSLGADGVQVVSLSSTDAAGNSASSVGSFVLDTAAPGAPALTSTDTNDSTPLLAGTAEAGSTVDVTVGGATFRTTASAQGTWSVDTGTAAPVSGVFSLGADGIQAVSLTSTDAAGNASGANGTFVLDSAAPVSPTLASTTDTNDSTPLLTGTAEAGSTVDVTVGGATFRTTASAQGTWSVDTGTATPSSGVFGLGGDGSKAVLLTSTDAAGNSSSGSGSFKLDTTPPLPPMPFGAPGPYTNDATPVLVGLGEPGSTVTVTFGGAVFSTVVGDGTPLGSWSIDTGTATPISGSFDLGADGSKTMSLLATDAAGNVSLPFPGFMVTLDTVAPTRIGGTPADGGTVSPSANLVLTFSEALRAGASGTLTLSDGAGDVRIIDITDASQVKIAGTTLTIDPTINLRPNQTYHLLISAGALTDLAGNPYAGISAETELDFTAVPVYQPLQLSAMTDGFAINGQKQYDGSGWSVAGAGDVNGDGLDDLIVGASEYDDPLYGADAGRSYVVFGRTGASAVELSDIAAGIGGFAIDGQSPLNYSGWSVSAAGDINGDGLADLLVGAYGAKPPASNPNTGRTYVIYGKATGESVALSAVAAGTGGFVINGESGSGLSGYSVAGAGDVNGDGRADLLISAAYQNAAAGRSYVVFGQDQNTPIDLGAVSAGSGGFAIDGAASGDYSGWSVAGAGDVNGDGLADLVIGARASAATAGAEAGRAYVVFGKSSTAAVTLSSVVGGSGGFVINGQSAGDASGFSVRGVGDVNGDGLADVVIGAPASDPAGGTNAGRSYVVFGKAGTAAVDLSGVAAGVGGFVIHGEGPAGDRSGQSVSGAGDINGDGLADLIVGAPLATSSAGVAAGRSYVVYGKTGTDAVDLATVGQGNGGFVIEGQNAGDNNGRSVSRAGDVNGDGLADLIVGAPFADPGGIVSGGRSYVVFGGTDGPFHQTRVDQLGTAAGDTLTDAGVAQTLVGGAGDDALTAMAASVLYGGAGSDTFGIGAGMIAALQATMGSGGNIDRLARVEGGGGIDTLALAGAGLTLDLTQVLQPGAGGSRIQGIEIVDLTGSGANTLRLSAQDVLDLSGLNAFAASGTSGRHELMVRGDNGDTLQLADESQWNSGGQIPIGGSVYDVWNHNNTLATIYSNVFVPVGV